jgi:hypothetical protein
VELKRRVVGQHSVIRRFRRDQIRIWCERGRINAGRHGRIETPVDAEQSPASDVLCEDVVRRASASPAETGVHGGELFVCEDRVLVKEVRWPHHLPIRVGTTTVYRFFDAKWQVSLAIQHR